MKINMRSFEGKIAYMLGQHGLPIAPFPTAGPEVAWQRKFRATPDLNAIAAARLRIHDLRTTLLNQMDKVAAVSSKLESLAAVGPAERVPDSIRMTNILADLAEALADITITCAAESQRFGLPLKEVLGIVVDAEMSKGLGMGEPNSYDYYGRVIQGPQYMAPTETIRLLVDNEREAYFAAQPGSQADAV